MRFGVQQSFGRLQFELDKDLESFKQAVKSSLANSLARQLLDSYSDLMEISDLVDEGYSTVSFEIEVVEKGETKRICEKERKKAKEEAQKNVAELVRAFGKLIDVACECQDWQCFPARALEEAQDALAKWEAKK